MTDDKLHTEQVRAMHAERLLNDTLLNECIERVRNGYVLAWSATKADDVAKREQLWNALRALDDVMKEVRCVADTGKMAKIAVERLIAKANQDQAH